MDGSFLHPVLHGGVSLRLDVVENEELDFSHVSLSELDLVHCSPPAFLSCSFGTTLGKELCLFACRHGRNDLFTRFKVIKALNSLESVFTFRASPISDFHVRLLGAIAIGGRLSSTLRAEND